MNGTSLNARRGKLNSGERWKRLTNLLARLYPSDNERKQPLELLERLGGAILGQSSEVTLTKVYVRTIAGLCAPVCFV